MSERRKTREHSSKGSFAESIQARARAREEAVGELAGYQAALRLAMKQVIDTELYFDPRKRRTVSLKAGATPLTATYYKHAYWHDDDGQPEEVPSKAKTVDLASPFVSDDGVEVDYDQHEVVFKARGLSGDNHHDYSFSHSGCSAWWELRVNIDDLADLSIVEEP